ncbi:MAG: MFS transporter, partial [Clostridia bacterium]|nr:MFS transporter [Clostridia bacterium]
MKTYNRNALVLLFSVTYFVSYLTRINYGAVISEMEATTGFSKQLLSMAVTGSFITYGAGQILTGILGDRISPKKLVRLGLIITVSMNFILPFCDFSPWLMAVVWSINGLAQAFMWPPIVKLLLSIFNKTRYTKAILRVTWGSSIATIVTYLFAPFIILTLNWKGVFFFSATCGVIMIVLWQIFCPDIQP